MEYYSTVQYSTVPLSRGPVSRPLCMEDVSLSGSLFLLVKGPKGPVQGDGVRDAHRGLGITPPENIPSSEQDPLKQLIRMYIFAKIANIA